MNENSNKDTSMNKRTAKIVAAVLLVALVVFASGHEALAQNGTISNTVGSVTKIFGVGFFDWVAQGLANLMNAFIMIAGLLVTMAGAMLNFSVNLTLNIRDFVNSSPAIYNTWRALRDISGLFIIFFLLYAALQLILGLENPKWSDLIKNIVMAGVLINFSFFFAGLGIDASNIVSVQLYNAIAPANSLNSTLITQNMFSSQGGSDASSAILNDGGLSDIFMSALRIPALYKGSYIAGTGQQTAAGGALDSGGSLSAPFKVLLIGVIAVIIEITAAFSFAAAALAFIIRFVILLFLLAFSPLWFISFISPSINEYVKQWKEAYKSMLIFMPVYLLLMYLAMNVLTSAPLFGAVGGNVTATPGLPATAAGSVIGSALAAAAASTASAGSWQSSIILLGVNAAIVIVLLDMPLIVAMSIAGKGSDIFGKIINTKKIGAGAMWKGFSSQAGSRTLGRSAYALKESGMFGKLASSSPILGSLASSGLTKVTKAGFGGGKKGSYEERLKAKKTSRADTNKGLGKLDKRLDTNYQEAYERNISWKASPGNLGLGGVIGFLVDNRANIEAQAAFKSERKDIAIKNEAAQAKKDDALIQDAINNVDRSINTINRAGKMLPEDLKKHITQQVADIDERIADMDKRIADLRLKAKENENKTQGVLPSATGNYNKKASDMISRADLMEFTKKSLQAASSAVIMATAPSMSDKNKKAVISNLEEHADTLKARSRALKQKQDEAKQLFDEERDEKLFGRIKNEIKESGGGGGGGEKKSGTS